MTSEPAADDPVKEAAAALAAARAALSRKAVELLVGWRTSKDGYGVGSIDVDGSVRDGLIVYRFKEAVETNLIVVLLIVHVVLDSRDPTDRPAVRLSGRPVLRFGVLEERILRGREQRVHVAAQLRHP